jgi:type IX secretion system PorP/SprF family membrane protein
MDNPTQINPAYSLTNTYGSVNFTAHKQWAGVPGSPTTVLVNSDFPLRYEGTKGGVFASDNSMGVEHVSQLNGFFAKSIRLSANQSLGVSINAGVKYYKTSYAPLDPLDPAIQNDLSQFKPNVGLGIVFYSDDYYIGLSAPEVSINGTSNLLDNNNFRNRYYLTGGLTSEINQDFKLKPAAMVYFSRGVPPSVDLSVKLAVKDVFGIGVNYRNTNEVAALFSIDQNSFHLGYSYQFNTSSDNIGNFGNSTHEITLSFLFGKGNQVPINPGNR